MSSTTSTITTTRPAPPPPARSPFLRLVDLLGMPLLAIFTAFVVGGIVIWVTSGSLATVVEAYSGLIRGAFIKQRGFSETLVASVPYIFLALGVAVGFKSGLFNIGVEGQFYIGALCAAWIGQAFTGLPAIVHLPLSLLAGAIGGAIWAGVPGFLKAKTGAHEVISTMMLNYVAFRFVEFVVGGPLRAKGTTAVQTPSVDSAAELWSLYSVPARLRDPFNALGVALACGFVAWLIARWLLGRDASRKQSASRTWIQLAVALGVGVVAFLGLPALTQAWWPFQDQYDRLHIGLILAIGAAVLVWWLLWKTTIGFELRTTGANPSAARYAGMNMTRNTILAMAISGGLAGIAGTVEVLGVSICHCLPQLFVSGYGFDSIAISLLGKNNPFGILASAFLFGAMRNGQDLMELNSGVSKYIISLIQAFVLLFVAAPAIVRWIYRIKGQRGEAEAPLTRGWGGG